MKSSIVQIAPRLFDIYYRIEQAEGELTPEMEKELKVTQEEFASVIEDYSVIVDQYESEIEKNKQFISGLESRIKSLENKKEYFKNLITNAIKTFGEKGVTNKGLVNYKVTIGDFGEIALTPSQSLEVTDEEKVPSKFKTRKASIDLVDDKEYEELVNLFKNRLSVKASVRKNDIKEALKKNEDVDGVELVTNYRIVKKIKAAKV